MSIRLSPTAYRLVCGTGFCWCWPSSRAAMWWSKAKAFQANRPPGWSDAATLSKVRRRSAQVGRHLGLAASDRESLGRCPIGHAAAGMI
jgi:hypothetical protein